MAENVVIKVQMRSLAASSPPSSVERMKVGIRIFGAWTSRADVISIGIARLAKRASVSDPRPNCARITASSTAPLTIPNVRQNVVIPAFLIRYVVLISKIVDWRSSGASETDAGVEAALNAAIHGWKLD